MAEVVEHRRREDRSPLLFGDLQCGSHAIGDLEGAEGVLHPGMVCAWEHKIGETELVHSVEALHLRSLEQAQVDAAQLDAPVNAVMDDLIIWHTRKIKIGLYIGFEKPGYRGRCPGEKGSS
jgi:hypothetical protein